ncbi:MAG TPA: SPOR domain-containing protein [Vicinamibacterales bacterium]
MSDEGFREIQLNGKQLVFLFMTATVVCVVIFLCGVMVGRGVVRAQQLTELTRVAADVPTDPTVVQPPAAAASAGALSDAPLSTQETLTYPDRLAERTPPAETLRGALPAIPEPAAEIPPAARATAGVSDDPGEQVSGGFVVQVAAVRQSGEADSIARRLSTKGYPAFVTSPPGAAHLFRVRVGTYKDRREAESIAARLEKEEQFKPWITR